MALLRSIALFLWGVLKRFYFWLPAILLDPFDLYNQYIKSRLPPEWQGDIEMPSEAFPYVLAGGLIWASVMTYHELRSSVGRDPQIPNKLRQFYLEPEEFIERRITTETEYKILYAEVGVWIKTTKEWIKQNMSDAAVSRFMDDKNVLPISRPNAIHDQHRGLINVMIKLRENLQSLVESDAWDRKNGN